MVVNAAAVCLSSGYSDEELQSIWRHEVSPALAPNLLNPTGEWAGFDVGWLESEILQRRKKLTDRLAAQMGMDHWREVCRLRRWLSTWPASGLDGVVQTLGWITRSVYFETNDGSVDMPTMAPEALERLWEEGAAPLVSALHFRGHEAPLAELL